MDLVGRLGLADTHLTVAPLSVGLGLNTSVLTDHVSLEWSVTYVEQNDKKLMIRNHLYLITELFSGNFIYWKEKLMAVTIR